MKNFEIDNETKQMIQEISATFGVKSEIIREVWEFTIFTILLKVAENPDKAQAVNIPFFGHIRLKDNGIIKESDGTEYHDIQPIVALSDSFKKLYINTLKNQYGELSDYLEEKYIKPVINEIN